MWPVPPHAGVADPLAFAFNSDFERKSFEPLKRIGGGALLPGERLAASLGMVVDPVVQRRFQLFDALLGLFHPGRVIDLGAGHGSFSVRAADAGWRVTALDARTVRFQDDPRVTWVQSDARHADVSGYDLILCLGLFYHLTLEDQLNLLERASGTPLMIDTHLANGAEDARWKDRLSGPVKPRGYQGRLFREGGRSSPTASWGNEESFWPTPGAFYRMLDEHGYAPVLTATPWYQPDRTFFLCLPR